MRGEAGEWRWRWWCGGSDGQGTFEHRFLLLSISCCACHAVCLSVSPSVPQLPLLSLLELRPFPPWTDELDELLFSCFSQSKWKESASMHVEWGEQQRTTAVVRNRSSSAAGHLYILTGPAKAGCTQNPFIRQGITTLISVCEFVDVCKIGKNPSCHY